MTEPQSTPEPVIPDVQEGPDTLDTETKAMYLAVKASFTDSPDEIPEKFREAQDPAYAYVKSYRELASYKELQQGFHEGNQPPVEEDTPPVEAESPETIDSLDFQAEKPVELSGWDEAMQLLGSSELPQQEKARAYLKSKHGLTDDVIDGPIKQAVQDRIKSEIEKVSTVVGGVENYKALHKWVMKNKTEAEIAEINNAGKAGTVARESILRGLMDESGIGQNPNKPLKPGGSVVSGPSVVGYESNAELWADLARPEIKNAYHPDHQKVAQEIQARTAATKPGILM